MPFRPIATHRKNIRGVIYPLTAAIARLYGVRNDGAYPLGAFYTVNIDSKVWQSAGGIWYQPINPADIDTRNIREEDIELFVSSITTGEAITLRSGKIVTWEEIPMAEAIQLPQTR